MQRHRLAYYTRFVALSILSGCGWYVLLLALTWPDPLFEPGPPDQPRPVPDTPVLAITTFAATTALVVAVLRRPIRKHPLLLPGCAAYVLGALLFPPVWYLVGSLTSPSPDPSIPASILLAVVLAASVSLIGFPYALLLTGLFQWNERRRVHDERFV